MVRKSTKPKPRCVPVPVIFLGKRTVFSSPKVLATKDKHRNLRTEACAQGGLAVNTLMPLGDKRCMRRHVHSHVCPPPASLSPSGPPPWPPRWVPGRGRIRLETLLEQSQVLSDNWRLRTPVLSTPCEVGEHHSPHRHPVVDTRGRAPEALARKGEAGKMEPLFPSQRPGMVLSGAQSAFLWLVASSL